MEARLLVFFCTKNRPPSCLFLDFCTHRVWYKPEIFVFGSCHVAVHLISLNVSDLGKSDVGYLQFPFMQNDLNEMKSMAGPAVGSVADGAPVSAVCLALLVPVVERALS